MLSGVLDSETVTRITFACPCYSWLALPVTRSPQTIDVGLLAQASLDVVGQAPTVGLHCTMPEHVRTALHLQVSSEHQPQPHPEPGLMPHKWIKRLSLSSSRRQRDEGTEAQQAQASQADSSLGRSSAPEGRQGPHSVPSTPRQASGSWIRRLSLPGGSRQSITSSNRQTGDASPGQPSSQSTPWLTRLSFGASKASRLQSGGGAGSGSASSSQPSHQTGWLRRWSLPNSDRSEANAVTERSSVSAAPQQLVGKLTRRSWPFSRPSLQAENADEDAEEDPGTALQNSLARVSIVRNPVGGGEYKGALPGVNGLPGTSPRGGQLRFEDALIGDLLVQVFQHLTLEVGTLR